LASLRAEGSGLELAWWQLRRTGGEGSGGEPGCKLASTARLRRTAHLASRIWSTSIAVLARPPLSRACARRSAPRWATEAYGRPSCIGRRWSPPSDDLAGRRATPPRPRALSPPWRHGSKPAARGRRQSAAPSCLVLRCPVA